MNSTGKLNGDFAAVNKVKEVLSLLEVCAEKEGENSWLGHTTTFRDGRAEIACKASNA